MFLSVARILQGATEAPLPGWIWAPVIALGASLAALAWVVAQLRTSRRRLVQLGIQQESTTAAHRELLERERKQAKSLDEKRSEIAELKRDVAAQRKKTHASQEEVKELRKEARKLTADLNEARQKPRPAFASKPEAKAEDNKPQPKPSPVPEAPAPVEEKPSPNADPALEARVADLEAQVAGKQNALAEQRTEAKAMRSELKSLRRRVEGLRRIDLISTGKIELLEDKLRVLGRRYYDAVSELAAIKGEVQPPAPRVLDETHQGRDEIVEMAAADDEPADDFNSMTGEEAGEDNAAVEVGGEDNELATGEQPVSVEVATAEQACAGAEEGAQQENEGTGENAGDFGEDTKPAGAEREASGAKSKASGATRTA